MMQLCSLLCAAVDSLDSFEFTIQSESSFDPSIHLTLQDMALDKRESPSIVSTSEAVKTDPFAKELTFALAKQIRSYAPLKLQFST